METVVAMAMAPAAHAPTTVAIMATSQAVPPRRVKRRHFTHAQLGPRQVDKLIYQS
jgi:hypothetical protein